MSQHRYPSLYQINTRVWLTAHARQLGRPATLDDISDLELDQLADLGVEWIWLLGVWQTGPASRAVSLSKPDWRHEYAATLPDLTDADIGGSCFAITDYRVHDDLGGDAALARVRQRLVQRDLKLMLDFVPNHMALDHGWINTHPEYFVPGTPEQIAAQPQNFIRLQTADGERIFAYGRDPYFDGWPDTLQINYAREDVQEAMTEQLLEVAHRADGVRCDMAMLMLPDVFRGTWHLESQPFWPDAVSHVKRDYPDFTFMAEVYWDREWELQQQGFDYTYDKRLYDRLHGGALEPVRQHLWASLDFQARSARFMENHDEPRAAATFPHGKHQAAATITYLSPGLRFFHQGQFEGKRLRISPHLVRGPDEPIDGELQSFYARLIELLKQPVLGDGRWQLVDCRAAWDGNSSCQDFMAFAWDDDNDHRLLVAVNYADHSSQCYVQLPWLELAGHSWQLTDRLSDEQYLRDGSNLLERGLYLDVPPWHSQALVFERV